MSYTLNQLLALPKCELHLHLEGVVTAETLWKLKQLHNIELPGIRSREDLVKRLRVNSLAEFIDCFINVVQACLRHPDDLRLVGSDLGAYLRRNNIVYAEVFFAPSKLLRNGLSYDHIADALQQNAETLSRQGHEVRYLIDVSRSFGIDNAARNLKLILRHPRPAIIGIGLGGDERNGPAALFAPIFQRAATAGLHRVAHAGEDVGPESIRDAIELLQVERIGHATSLAQDRRLLQEVRRRRIPVEACPSSNVFTGRYVRDYREHPVSLFLNEGVIVSVHSDDPTFFGAELNDEYRKLHQICQLSPTKIARMMTNSIVSSFASQSTKAELLCPLERLVDDG